jgi:hypothetical protein
MAQAALNTGGITAATVDATVCRGRRERVGIEDAVCECESGEVPPL